jgi:hypothetical protein
MLMVKDFGGVVTVLVGNTRKALTILLSFILFPKPGSILYVIGTILVFGGLTGQVYLKENNGGKNKSKIDRREESPQLNSVSAKVQELSLLSEGDRGSDSSFERRSV